jgi:hypothetical protein
MPKTQFFDGTDWNDVSDIFMFVPDAFDPDLDDPAVWAAIQGKVTTQNSDPSAAAHPVQKVTDPGDRPGTWVPVNPASFLGAPGAADPSVKFRKWLNPDPPVVVAAGAISVSILTLAASAYVSTKVTVVVRASNANATRPMTVTITAPGATSISTAQTVPAKTTKDLTFTFIAPAAAVASLAVTAHGASAAGTGSASNPVTAVKAIKILAKPAPRTITLTASATTAEMYAKNSGTTFTKQTTTHEHDLNQGKFTGSGTATTGVRMSFLGIPATAVATIPAGVVPKSVTVTLTRTTSGGLSGAVDTYLRASGLGPAIPTNLGTGSASALKQIGAVEMRAVSRGEHQDFVFNDPAFLAAWAARQVHSWILGSPSLGTAEYANYEPTVKIVATY